MHPVPPTRVADKVNMLILAATIALVLAAGSLVVLSFGGWI